MPTPADIPTLEASRTAAPGDADILTSLGVAYREDERLPEARAVLEEAIALDPTNSAASYYLGLTAEDQEDYAGAASVYEAYLTSSASSGLDDDIADRLRRVQRLALLDEVRSAIAAEASVSALPPTPGAVGVFPFRYSASNAEYRPLATAMAELLTVDLNQVDRVTVLERFRVQALLDEIALSEAGLVDPASGSRSGRLLRVERMVQGDIGGIDDQLSSTALLVEAATGVTDDQVESSDVAQRFIEMEKELAFGLFEGLGIVLTAAERERIESNRTENLQALLAFGRGLAASDGGDFEEAQRQFQVAVSLDPGFTAAADAASEAAQLDRGFGTTTTQAAALAGQELAAGLQYTEWLARRYGFTDIESLTPYEIIRDPVPEILGEETVPITPSVIRIIFPRPGGEE